MICHSENILEVGQAWPNHNTMDSFYEHQEKTSMLKWMPCPVYCHLNLKAWEIHYPACMTHPVNQNSMKHMLLTAKVFFPFIFREGPRDSLPLGFFSVYLLNNQSLRWIFVDTVFCHFLLLFFSCPITFFLLLLFLLSGVSISMMLLHSVRSIVLGVGIGFGSQVEPSSHEKWQREHCTGI